MKGFRLFLRAIFFFSRTENTCWCACLSHSSVLRVVACPFVVWLIDDIEER